MQNFSENFENSAFSRTKRGKKTNELSLDSHINHPLPSYISRIGSIPNVFLLQSEESKLPLFLKGKSRPSALSPTEDKPTHNGFTPLLEHKGGKHTAGLRPLSGGEKEKERESESER